MSFHLMHQRHYFHAIIAQSVKPESNQGNVRQTYIEGHSTKSLAYDRQNVKVIKGKGSLGTVSD